MQEVLERQLPPVWEEEVVGEAVILKVFKLTGARRASVGGCRVKQGKLVRNAHYRIVRDGEVLTIVYNYRLLHTHTHTHTERDCMEYT